MDDLLTPADIEARAAANGISIAEVCRRANVAASTFSRWKTGATEPTLGVYRRLRDAAAQASSTIRHPAPEPISTLPAGDPDSVSHANDEAARRGDAPTVAPHRHSIPEAA